MKSDKLQVASFEPRTHTESTEMGWIATVERLPEPITCVLVYVTDDPCSEEPMVDMAEFTAQQDWRLIGIDTPLPIAAVSHWMPLPEPPQ